MKTNKNIAMRKKRKSLFHQKKKEKKRKEKEERIRRDYKCNEKTDDYASADAGAGRISSTFRLRRVGWWWLW